MKREIIKTADGSTTIRLPELDENYHSSHGAIQEAEHVFIQNGLKKMEELGHESIAIFELGFGTGLNALLTKIRSFSQIAYIGIEAYPVSQEELDAMNYIDILGERYFDDFYDIHRAKWDKVEGNSHRFLLKKVHAKIQDYTLQENTFDLVYFDAFGPRAQAEMWEIEILQKMHDGLKIGGALITYCANGEFKRNLKSIGFEIEALPGPPGKREMTRAWKR